MPGKSWREMPVVSHDGHRYIILDDFMTWLRNNTVDNKDVRRSTIHRYVKTHRNGISNVNGQVAVNTKSIIRYIASRCEEYDSCQIVLDYLEKHLFSDKADKEDCVTLLELYKEISTQQWRSLECESVLFDNIDIDDTCVPSVHVEYRDHFTAHLCQSYR